MKSSGQAPVSQLNTILILFIVMRFTLLLLYTPQGLLNAYTDYHHYYRTALMSEHGALPHLSMWYEYPPLSAYWVQAVYRAARTVMPPGDLHSLTYLVFSRLLGMTLLMVECGILILLHRLGEAAWGIERANFIAWVYACLSLPLFYWSYSHQDIAVFFLLAGMLAVIHRGSKAAGMAVGLGILAKITPAILLGPALRWLWPDRRRILWTAGLALAVAAAGYLPFLSLGGGRYVAASFTALGSVHSYSTPWALLDRNWGTGDYGPLEIRLDPALASDLPGNPPVVPGWVTLLVFGALYARMFFRRMPMDHAGFIRFTALTMVLFLLWSKGWSPQWSVLVVPLILLSYPNNTGIGMVLALTGITILEWPLAAAFSAHGLLASAIVARTGLWGWLGVRLWRDLKAPPSGL